MMEKIEGIIIGESAYSETSKIISILTPQYGLISCLAKGSRTLKSELRSVTCKMTYGFFHMHYKPDKLSTLVGVDVIDTFKQIKKDIVKISYASFILELSSQVMKQNYNEKVYQLLVSTLKKMNEGFDSFILTNILELKYLEYLGVMPVLDSCCVCGKKTSIATLSSDRGGYICNHCLTNEKIVNEKTVKLVRMFYYVEIDKITSLEIKEDIKKEINIFIENYYDRYTGLYLKSKSFLQNLNKVELK